MKDLFPGYYRPTQEEFDDLWKKATFVFDSSVLLHVHRRNKKTRRAMLDTFKKLGDRLWLPYEIAAEYQRNKLKVAHSPVDSCTPLLEGLTKLKEQLKSRDLREHPFLDAEALAKGLDQLSEQVTKAQGSSRSVSLDDEESIELASLLRGRIGEPYSGDARTNKLKDAKARAEKKIPPGFKDFDSKKDEDLAGGDALIWFKLLERAKEKQCPIILVTEDQKEDWWLSFQGRIHGPRPELGQEMWREAQQRFYMYTLSSFLELVGRYLGQPVPAEVVKEVKEHEQEQKERVMRRPTASQSLNKQEQKAPVRRYPLLHGQVPRDALYMRFRELSLRKERMREERDMLLQDLAALDAKFMEDPYSPEGFEDRRRYEDLKDLISKLNKEIDRAAGELHIFMRELTRIHQSS
ncbi:PIN-like domain-containing protein [Cystobacter fuscus]|uniref:PIN-like domain-containing protein n=1 Tax=Cystobacter fuscus TaxID=43 RepID=UPI002B2E18C1|nr:hypothetical protein F0U63_23300 [Cystobacter fuscus]